MSVYCNICQKPADKFSAAMIRGKYNADFWRCSVCEFIFVQNPTWLAEAYAEPINRSDTGYVARNLWARNKIRECIELHLNPDGVFLDYAAGYGLFVRLMRDLGYDFRWSDLYCQNLFCRGFEAAEPLAGPFEMVTAFEVFEHLVNPVEEMEKLSAITPCLIFSTRLVPEPTPLLHEWWYYGLEHGQHVAFYTRKSLAALAQRFGYQFATNGEDIHVFSRSPVPANFFFPPHIPRWRFWNRSKRHIVRKSLTVVDHDFIVKEISQGR